MIRIACKGSRIENFEKLRNFQGELKKRSKKEIDQIITSIEKYGFSFPFHVWTDKEGIQNILDGHGRVEALLRMKRAGEEIPFLPVVDVDAESVEEAKQKLLRFNSTYGKMTKTSINEFIEGMAVEIEELSLPSGFLNLEEKEKEEKPEIEFTEELGEAHNYLVLYFDNDIDWLQLQTIYPLDQKKALDSKRGFEKIGIGRVVKGSEFLNKVRNEY